MSAVHLGFYNTSGTRTRVRLQFSTHAATGGNTAPSSAFEAADIRIYRAADSAAFSATERNSANGVTMTSPFDTLVGFHEVDIDLTDNTDAGFYASGYLYSIVLSPDETVDSQTLTGVVLGYFEIGSITGVALTSAYDFAKGTVAMTESYNADGAAATPIQALYLCMQRLTEFAISSTTITVKKLDGSTTAYTLTMDSATAPTSSTRAT